MKITRRQFIKLSAMSGAAAGAFAGGLLSWPRRAYAFYQSPALTKFGPGQVLRGVGPTGIPVAAPDVAVAPVTGVKHYTVNIKQFTDQLHPALGPTTLWGYDPAVPLGGGVQPQRHLGGIMVATKGVPVQMTFHNMLPATHILPVDTTVTTPGMMMQNTTSVHLHGGFVPWISDGVPGAWIDPAGMTGPSFINNQVLNPTALPGQAEHYYPNNQSARFMWYHDHAHGITRLNAYAGLATAYLLRDLFEGNLRNIGLPDYIENGGREIPIVIQDKIFVDAANILTLDPTWPGPATTGSLWYPHLYDRWMVAAGGLPLPDPSVIPEMFGDTMLANGTVYPVATVEPRRYRLRILNACQARFLNLQLYVDDGSPDGITLNPVTFTPMNAPGPDFLVIGTEGGFLHKPVLRRSNIAFDQLTHDGSLITGPAERWDIIVDFSAFAGMKVILYNDAPAPFPTGDPLNDYFPGAPGNLTITNPGFGPNTRQILRFDVGLTATAPADGPLGITVNTDMTPGLDPFVAAYDAAGVPRPPAGVTVRSLTLNESSDANGRLIQMLGTNVPPVAAVPPAPPAFGRAYTDPATETPLAGAVEIWEIANLTGDTHPMHFHLINAQVLWRRPFNAAAYAGVPTYTGLPQGPPPHEQGWKETIKMNPGEVTAIIMQFTLPVVPFVVPPSPATGGNEYVWHCHILEHEEHDMMRPLVVM